MASETRNFNCALTSGKGPNPSTRGNFWPVCGICAHSHWNDN